MADQQQPINVDPERPALAGVSAEEFQRAVQQEIERRELDRRDQQQRDADQARQDAEQHADKLWQPGYHGPAPWEIARQFAADHHQVTIDPFSGTPSRTPLPYVGPGAVHHAEPSLTYGAADVTTGGAVSRLVGLLRILGHDDTRDPLLRAAGVLDNTVMSAVHRFCAEYGVTNDPVEFHGRAVPAGQLVDNHVGPYIWQALYHAVEQHRQELHQAA